jgi:hypothetical protein
MACRGEQYRSSSLFRNLEKCDRRRRAVQAKVCQTSEPGREIRRSALPALIPRERQIWAQVVEGNRFSTSSQDYGDTRHTGISRGVSLPAPQLTAQLLSC